MKEPRSMSNMALILLAVLAVAGLAATSATAGDPDAGKVQASPAWRTRLASVLPEFGHRNWIVIADSAYPKQSAAGIETIYTGASQLEVLDAVLKAADGARHVYPAVLLDAELASVPESRAPGVEAYRKKLKQQLTGKQVEVLPHEDIIEKLDEASKLFNVLILKTDMTIPYTSIFLRLECGYWDATSEAALRESLRETKE